MASNKRIIETFYEAFKRKDYSVMQSLYHEKATFSDPVFVNLSSREVKAMWEMLIKASNDLKIDFKNVTVKNDNGSCSWQAWYTFTKTGKAVHNLIDASFEFKEGLIFRHRDTFDFRRWARMALGAPGVLLGWSGFLKNKVRKSAKKRLDDFLSKQT